MIEDRLERRLIATVIAIVIDALAAEHFEVTQEPSLTDRIGQSLEDLWLPLPRGFEITILTHSVSDRGPKADEPPTGTDLYVGIEVTIDGTRKTKGFLVQAKWDGGPKDGRLEDQCRKMLDISEDSYVWSYGPSGIKVEHARDVLRGIEMGNPASARPRHIEDLFDGVFECNEGDRKIGLPGGPNHRRALGDMIKRTAAEVGLALLVSKKPKASRGRRGDTRRSRI